MKTKIIAIVAIFAFALSAAPAEMFVYHVKAKDCMDVGALFNVKIPEAKENSLVFVYLARTGEFEETGRKFPMTAVPQKGQIIIEVAQDYQSRKEYATQIKSCNDTFQIIIINPQQ